MLTVTTRAELRAELARARADAAVLGGGRVAFVPTMGFLHEGHLQLVDVARAQGDIVVMSIFVNPLQFAPTEDLARYPRDPEGDAAKAKSRGVDLLFVPTVDEIYPRQPRVLVAPGAIAERWEGAVRPGHFAGVLTVVSKLFHLVQPDVAVFGQKDVQQATLIRAMVADLDMPIELVIAPTTREPDGLALSSRNVYLSPDDRAHALGLSRALRATDVLWQSGERDAARLTAAGRAVLDADDALAVDYFAVADAETLAPFEGDAPGDAVAMVAARVGKTRLIDNLPLRATERGA